jgi:capsular polysaccharide export protein
MSFRPQSLVNLLSCRRIVLLQGPMGPFFRHLATYLTSHGAEVRRVLLNGGDWLFHFGPGTERFTGTQAAWPDWLAQRLRGGRADALVLFGQSRPMHRQAIAVAQRLGVPVYVFEEGYLRPDFVTLEPGGVNGRSSLPREVQAYDDAPARAMRPLPTAPSFARLALFATGYALAMAACRPLFPHALHHRPLNPLAEAACWLRGGWRKLVHRVAERRVLPLLTAPAHSRRWFLLALQVHNDAQIADHSRFSGMPEVIAHVLASFAAEAPPGAALVVKHHPMDRAYRDYGRLIRATAQALGIADRVLSVHDLHLPTLLRHAAGVVTVNSTVGLQALYHGRPVCVLGEAIYGLPGLVHRDGLASFWRAPAPVDRALFARFRATLIARTQLNASFSGRMPALAPLPAVPLVEPSAFGPADTLAATEQLP